ncbi:hypothetical protein BH09PLA1_BH09PLA1_28430 [soil metagenome]
MKIRTVAFLAIIVALANLSLAAAVPYNFVLQPSSGLATTTASATAKTSGSLIGDWDAATNPTGTRTKPGLAGAFGDTENVAVPATINFGTSGTPHIPLGGSFGLSIDLSNDSILMSGYGSSMSAPASGPLAASATITTQSFRTRSPTSTFFGGIPVTIPIGDATVTSLDIFQTEDVTGVLVPTGTPGTFNFTIVLPVEVTLGVDVIGNSLQLGPAPTLLPMQGTIEVNGTTAMLSSLAPLDLAQQTDPALPLPPLPFALPTILPTGGTANVIFNLTLDQITTSLIGSLATNAAGTAVPEPTSALALMTTLCALKRAGRRATRERAISR